MKQKIFIYSFLVVVTVIGLWYFQHHQLSVDYRKCELCDGKQYQKAYQYFSGQSTRYEVKFPFHSRVLVPWLAAQLSPKDANPGFVTLLWVGTIITVILLLLGWQWLQIPWYLQIGGIFWLLFHWTGIIRFNLYDPITVDVPLYIFHSLLVLLLLRPRWLWLLLIITPIATAQKESWLAIVLVLTLYEFVYQWFFNQNTSYQKLWIYVGALVLAISTKWMLSGWFEPSNGAGKNSVITILFFIKVTLQNPLDLVRWVVAMFVGFGGVWLLTLNKLREIKLTHDPIITPLVLLAGLHLLLGILAGRDMTRIMFLGYPFLMTFILWLIRTESKVVIAIALVLSLPIVRLISVIPSQVSQNQLFQSWFSEYAPLGVVSAWAVYMMLSYWVIAILRKNLT